MHRQLTHKEYQPAQHGKEIHILADGVISPQNIGAFFRLADAFGVKKVWILSETETRLSGKAISVSRNTTKYVPHQFIKSVDQLPQDITWLCIELTNQSNSIQELRNLDKVGIILGHENYGVSKELLEKFPAYHIPTFGKNSSMNVSTALSIALYELVLGA